jgi:hypothetical protein
LRTPRFTAIANAGGNLLLIFIGKDGICPKEASVMRIARTNFDRHEQRRDRRYALPPLTVIIDDQNYVSDNWSLGGFHLTGPLPLEVGALVVGTLHVDGSDGFTFMASVVRKDAAAGTLAFHFQELTPLAVTRLDRALARRLVPRHRP